MEENMNLDWNGFYEFTIFFFFLIICLFACVLVFFINNKKYDLERLSFNELLSLFMIFLFVVILLDKYSIDFIKDDIKADKIQQKSSEEAKLEEEAVKLEYKNCINNSHVEEYECYLCIDRSSTNCLSYIKTSCKKTVYDVDDSARCEKIVESNKTKAIGWEDLSK